MASGFAPIYSTAVMQPGEVIVGEDAPHDSGNLDLDKKDDFGTSEVAPHYLEDDITREQALPEGPTVTKWEEWAYVSLVSPFRYARVMSIVLIGI
jgi:hypothetical protein